MASGLDEIQAAINAIDADNLDLVDEDLKTATADVGEAKLKPKLGLIGEGKGQTLSKNQRKRAL